MDIIIWEWAEFMLRWLHVIAGMAWIGSSFYFMHLDANLRPTKDLPADKGGEAWEVHGGGFYCSRKYLTAPEVMPDHLTWHKWQSYTTWLSGFCLLMVAYYASAELFLIDPEVADITVQSAWMIGIGGLALGWIIYNILCKSPLGHNETALAIVGFAFVIAVTFAFQQFFSGRGALLHAGAFMATIMSGNVFFIIIPNQRKVVASLIAGEKPDPKYGKEAKQRSTHNNYLTLPVVFLMLSNHYPLSFSTPYAYLVVACVLVSGALIRHWFNIHHAGKGNPVWMWVVAVLAIFVAIAISTSTTPVGQEMMSQHQQEKKTHDVAALSEEAGDIVMARCSMCHTDEPVWEGIVLAPKGVKLDNEDRIKRMAEAIYKQAAITTAMPPNNLTEITPEERDVLKRWYQNL